MPSKAAQQWIGTNPLVTTERRQLREFAAALQDSYMGGKWHLPPETLLTQLREQDPWMVQMMLQSLVWENLTGYVTDTQMERERAVSESERLYRTSPIMQWSIWQWTSWGLGDGVEVAVPDNDEANEAVTEFFTAERNETLFADDCVHELSNWLLVKGNRFVVFYTDETDGQTTARLIDQSQITLLANPQDSSDVWFYKREYRATNKEGKTLYYPDWRTFYSDEIDERWQALIDNNDVTETDATRADLVVSGENNNDDEELGERPPGTVAYIMHVRHNVKDETDQWGWPLATVGWSWTNEHKRFLEAGLTVAMAKAMFVRRKQVTGGSRAVAGIISTIASNLTQDTYTETNPPAAAGSVEIDNAMVSTDDLPMTTGASDRKTDNDVFTWMASLSYGLFPVTMGLDTARWATALEMDKAQSAVFEQYRRFWSSQFRRIAIVVLLARERYGGVSYGEYTISVNIDSFSLADFPVIARTLGQVTRDMLTPLVDNGTLETQDARRMVAEMWRVSLQALGVENVNDLLAFATVEREEEAPEEAPEPGEEPGTIEAIAAAIRENAEDGAIDWRQAAFTIGELVS